MENKTTFGGPRLQKLSPLHLASVRHTEATFCYHFGNYPCQLPREQFSHPASEALFQQLEEISQRSGVSRGVAFEDWLVAMVCALAAETKEAEYLAMIERHRRGKPGKRGCDLMAHMFAELITAMEQSDVDVLGDLFVGAISYGENGQYFTPDSVAQLLAQMTIDPAARPEPGKPIYVNDPCCGSGRMLLEAAQINPHVELCGQDVDSRCARIAALNLGLRGRYGWIVCGNSLSGHTSFAYRIGSFFHESPHGLRRGVIRDVPPETTPVPIIAGRARDQAKSLFAESSLESPVATPTMTIVEVPRWLARVEPFFAAGESSDGSPSTAAEPSPVETSQPAANDEQPRSEPGEQLPPERQQKRLF